MFTLDNKNLHHAYLIESELSLLPEIISVLESFGFKTSGNPDFFLKETDTFSIEDAREVKSFQSQKSFSGGKKIILISTKYFSRESQNALLKVLEEPTPNVHFFIVTPITSILIDTLKSRLFILKTESLSEKTELEKLAKDFLSKEKEERLSLVSKIIKKFEKEENTTSLKVYVVSFLNELEKLVSKKENREEFDISLIWKIKDYIHDQGSLVKNLLETLALTF